MSLTRLRFFQSSKTSKNLLPNQITRMPLKPLLLLLLTSATLSAATSLSAAHKELTSYGFPVGLLPSSIKSHHINQTTGEFSLDMGDTCRITLPPDNYLASYSKRITGRIVEKRIAEVDGIWVRAFYKWWGITGIRASGENLVFEVGMVTAKYPAKNFGHVPDCEGNRSSQ